MSRRARLALALAPALAAFMTVGAFSARAQTPVVQQAPPTTTDLLGSLVQKLFPTTTVAPPPPAPAPTNPPATDAPASASAASSGGSDTSSSSSGDETVPADAQALINSVHRGPAANDQALLAALKPLTQAAGLTDQEAAIIGMGQFPVAGPANWTDDWLEPRFTPTFHLHQGNDILAPRGTPIRAPDDGTLRYATEDAGGQAAYITTSDGTYYYEAHMDSFAKDLHTGSKVKRGQVVGYVGTTGDADPGAPHVHFEIHPKGGAAVDPNATLAKWIADAIAAVPNLLAQYQAGLPRALTDAGMLRRLDTGSLGGGVTISGAQAWMASLVRDGNGLRLVDTDPPPGGDPTWDPTATAIEVRSTEWLRAVSLAQQVLDPLTPRVLAGMFETG